MRGAGSVSSRLLFLGRSHVLLALFFCMRAFFFRMYSVGVYLEARSFLFDARSSFILLQSLAA